jgi:hypothetical protein
VLRGRCGPCCSVAPSGSRAMSVPPSRRISISGQVSESHKSGGAPAADSIMFRSDRRGSDMHKFLRSTRQPPSAVSPSNGRAGRRDKTSAAGAMSGGSSD